MTTRFLLAAMAALTLLAAACGSSASSEIELGEAFSFTPAVDTTAAYFTITNDGEADDVLLSASAGGFGSVELHDTVVEGGAASMVEQTDGIPIPAGGSVTLEPGGLHVMLISAEDAIAAGDEIEITLEFEEAGEVVIVSTVRDRGEDDPQPMDMDSEDMDMEPTEEG